MKYAGIALALMLVGCSSKTPSNGEVEDFFESSFKNCKTIEVVKVKRLNGRILNDGDYLVSTEVTLKTKPTSEQKKAVKEYLAAKEKYEVKVKENLKISDDVSVEVKNIISSYDPKFEAVWATFSIEARRLAVQAAVDREAAVLTVRPGDSRVHEVHRIRARADEIHRIRASAGYEFDNERMSAEKLLREEMDSKIAEAKKRADESFSEVVSAASTMNKYSSQVHDMDKRSCEVSVYNPIALQIYTMVRGSGFQTLNYTPGNSVEK